ncbi:MAG: GGDEF domain-containing protein [Desulfarculus sp.]|nr:GGDEF domain-containing protein [Desulfarculus sp.]
MLDNRTFMVAGCSVALVFLLAMLVITLTTRRYRGLGWWTTGNGFFTVGFLTLTLPLTPPWHWSLLVANVCSVAGVIVWNFGVRRFLDQGLPLWAAAASLALTVGVIHYFSAWSYNITIRIVFVSLTYSAWVLDLAGALGRARNGANSLSRRIFFATALVIAGFFVFRAAATIFQPPVQNLFQPNWLVSLSMAMLMLAVVAFNICFLALMAVRHEGDLQTKILELNQEIELRHALEERLAREATLDPLTGLANRRKLEELAAKSLAVARRHGRPLALLMMDIDHFKQINDQRGHQAGDAALTALAEICQRQLREEDTLARFGGDEFVALLPHTDLDQALETAERLRSEVESFGRPEGGPLPGLTISLGVSVFQPGDSNFAALLARADAALYQAKAQGRNRVCQALVGETGDLVLHCSKPIAAPA